MKFTCVLVAILVALSLAVSTEAHHGMGWGGSGWGGPGRWGGAGWGGGWRGNYGRPWGPRYYRDAGDAALENE